MRYNPKLHKYDEFTVRGEATLLEWLTANAAKSRSKAKATLTGRGVRVNNIVVTRHDHLLHAGDRVAVSLTKDNDRFKSRYVKIVYEDQWIIVIEKNIGILSMAAGHSSLNVKSVLDDYLHTTHQRCRAHVVHRLDRDTSGLMIYAKDMQTERVLELNWHDIVYDRRYVAVVSGTIEPQTGTIASWLTENKDCFTQSSPVDNGGKYAVTHYFTLDRNDRFSLVEFRLETGRKNQIRVHCADLGHPVCGDAKYGNGADPLHRLALHAFLLCLRHPVTGERLEFETPVPAGFKKIFSKEINVND